MPVGLTAPAELYPVKGVRLAATHCGIKSDTAVKDLSLIEIDSGSSVAAVFTRNRFCAAPVTIARQHLGQSHPMQYLLINSGNANAGTGEEGLKAAYASCVATAVAAGTKAEAILPFSTGVIATPLPIDAITGALPGLYADLQTDNWLAAAEGIMTTDTLPKAYSQRLEIADQVVTITGIAKGSGMIRPDMATMLAFVATDAAIVQSELQALMQSAVADSFNSITVDGDTSTNDACVLIATGGSGLSLGASDHEFVTALKNIFQQLAQAIIRDAEGATKFVEIEVQQAASNGDAREVAYTIAHSPLVKTALFASDPNWGRILAAIGRAAIAQLDIGKVDLYLGETCLLKQGLPDPDYSEADGQREMKAANIRIQVNLNCGEGNARIWTSDLSYDYVKINAEYRS